MPRSSDTELIKLAYPLNLDMKPTMISIVILFAPMELTYGGICAHPIGDQVYQAWGELTFVHSYQHVYLLISNL